MAAGDHESIAKRGLHAAERDDLLDLVYLVHVPSSSQPTIFRMRMRAVIGPPSGSFVGWDRQWGTNKRFDFRKAHRMAGTGLLA